MANLVQSIVQPQVSINVLQDSASQEGNGPQLSSPGRKIETAPDGRQRVPDPNYANPTITIKAHFVKSKAPGGRCLSGNPKKKKRSSAAIAADFSRGKVPKEGDKIYRLPSISKCLEHEILPRSSLMLKQICEIASSN